MKSVTLEKDYVVSETYTLGSERGWELERNHSVDGLMWRTRAVPFTGTDPHGSPLLASPLYKQGTL